MLFPSIEVEASPAYELIMSIAVGSDVGGAETYDELPRVPADLAGEVQAFSAGSDLPWAHLLSLAYDCPLPRDVATLFGHLESVDPMEMRLVLLGYYVRYMRRISPGEVIAEAAGGDATAQHRLLESALGVDEGWQAALAALLPLGAEDTKARVIALLRRWYDAACHEGEDEVLRILRRDAEAKATLPRDDILRSALPGMEYTPEIGIRRIILIPSLVIRPQIHSFEYGETKFLVYPVGNDSLAALGDAPSPHLLRLAKALGDERRLRVLKRLTTGEYTLGELADHFDVGSTTLLHHLVLLRAAGLIRVRGPMKRYSLRRETIARVGPMLDAFLTQEP